MDGVVSVWRGGCCGVGACAECLGSSACEGEGCLLWGVCEVLAECVCDGGGVWEFVGALWSEGFDVADDAVEAEHAGVVACGVVADGVPASSA